MESMRETDGCKLFGAYQALEGIQGSFLVIHSVPGCHFGTLAWHVQHNPLGIHQASTALGDQEIIFGGRDAVKKTLELLKENSGIQTVFLITGCVAELIQDDIAALCREYSAWFQIIPVNAAGFTGDLEDGYEEALLSLLPLMKRQERAAKQRPRVNVLGFGVDDPYAEGDLQQLEKLLGEQVKINLAFPFFEVEDLERAADADLNLVFGRGRRLAEAMQNKFGIPWEEIAYPYGLEGMKELWNILERQLGCNYRKECEEAERKLENRLLPLYPFLESFYHKNFAVYTDRARANGIKRFLEEELGMRCAYDKRQGEKLDPEEIKASEAALFFGSTQERDICQRYGMPLIRICYPCVDKLWLERDSRIGVEGTLQFIQEMINQCLAEWSDVRQ